VIVLGNGSNILGLMASQLGARRVTCIERGPMLYRVAKQTLQSNRHMKGTDSICLIDRQLQACGIKGQLASKLVLLFGMCVSQVSCRIRIWSRYTLTLKSVVLHVALCR
jgi:hypothetical protein